MFCWLFASGMIASLVRTGSICTLGIRGISSPRTCWFVSMFFGIISILFGLLLSQFLGNESLILSSCSITFWLALRFESDDFCQISFSMESSPLFLFYLTPLAP